MQLALNPAGSSPKRLHTQIFISHLGHNFALKGGHELRSQNYLEFINLFL